MRDGYIIGEVILIVMLTCVLGTMGCLSVAHFYQQLALSYEAENLVSYVRTYSARIKSARDLNNMISPRIPCNYRIKVTPTGYVTVDNSNHEWLRHDFLPGVTTQGTADVTVEYAGDNQTITLISTMDSHLSKEVVIASTGRVRVNND